METFVSVVAQVQEWAGLKCVSEGYGGLFVVDHGATKVLQLFADSSDFRHMVCYTHYWYGQG